LSHFRDWGRFLLELFLLELFLLEHSLAVGVIRPPSHAFRFLAISRGASPVSRPPIGHRRSCQRYLERSRLPRYRTAATDNRFVRSKIPSRSIFWMPCSLSPNRSTSQNVPLCEQVRTGGRELHVGSGLMLSEPATGRWQVRRLCISPDCRRWLTLPPCRSSMPSK
jgi:hypothetical protein